ncbi:MAG TPA: glycoside hydrolase family 38 C-terminal domain-containing protein, partial [bacterium]|nr:glycoside hydrolase family 38 C-terminal domain-containing protein [bacterium]
ILEQQGKAGAPKIPVVARDLSLYHAGTALTRPDLKIADRLGENLLLNAELFGVAASLIGFSYPENKLDKAWRQILFNQHHDAITGTCCDQCYFDLLSGYHEAISLARSALSDSTSFIAGRIDTSSSKKAIGAVVVFNPLGWSRTDTVTIRLESKASLEFKLMDQSGSSVPFDIVSKSIFNTIIRFTASNIPSAGYKTYFIQPDSKREQKGKRSISGNTIKNEYYSVTADPERGGVISSIIDKKTGREIIKSDIDKPGNELIVLKEDEGPHFTAWELSTAGVKGRSSEARADVTSVVSNSYNSLLIKGKIKDLGGYVQEIRLYKGVRRIDFITTIIDPAPAKDRTDRNFWVVRFPAELNGTIPVVEDRFFAASRRRSLEPLNYRTDLEKMLTAGAPYSAMNWVEEGATVRLNITDTSGKTFDSIPIGPCDIVHAKSQESSAAAEILLSSLIQRGVTCTPSFDTDNHNEDILNRTFRFIIDTSFDNSFVIKSGLSDGDIARYKKAVQDNGIAAFVFNSKNETNIPIEIPTVLIGASNASHLNEFISSISDSIKNKIYLEIPGENDFRTAHKNTVPDDYGIAVINRGTILSSFDNDGAIVMGLFHNAPWSAEMMNLDFNFPDKKNHRYEYSLFPHSGDWRNADTYKKALEYNNPLIAQTTGRHKGSLPSSASFFKVESGSGVLSAVKAAGNPYARMELSTPTGISNGVIFRFYEAEGRNEKIKLSSFSFMTSAIETNLIEEIENKPAFHISEGHSLDFNVASNSIETLFVKFKMPSKKPKSFSPASIDPKIRYSNYWELNLGAAYEYNSPVSISIDAPIEKKLTPANKNSGGLLRDLKLIKGKNKLRLAVSDNSVDAPIKGNLKITAPDGISFSSTPDNIHLKPL